MLLAAGPLLVTSISRDPLAVALAPLATQLPWVFFSLLAGVVIDRVDRRRLMIRVDVLRALVVAALAAAVFTSVLTLPLLYAGLFLFGTAETFAVNAASSMVPVLVPKHQLGIANSRFIGTLTVGSELAGPPIGAALYTLGHALPYASYAATLGLAAALYSRIRQPARPRLEKAGGSKAGVPPASGATAGPVARQSLRREVAEGLHWLRGSFPVRTLAMLITMFNITFGATFSMLVLYAQGQLGLGDLGYGLLISTSAVGGIVGTLVYPALERRFSYTTLLRAGLILETGTHLTLVLTHQVWLACVILFLFGIHALVWGSVSTTVRQRAVPAQLLGRVNSVYLLGSIGGVALGALVGGVLGQIWGFRAPIWFGFGGSLVILVLVWKSMSNIGRAGAN